MLSKPLNSPVHLVRIPDSGVTELLVTFADQFVLDKIKKGISVLDIGCGRGYFCKKMAEKGAIVTGVDIIAEEIEAAKQVGADERITYHCMNAEELETLNTQFDLIVSRYCYHHLDIPKAQKGIKACLKPGGRMVVIDCYEKFWSRAGRWYVMKTAWQAMGTLTMLKILPRLIYFFTPSRVEHVKSDIRRLKMQARYTFAEVEIFYKTHFPDCTVGEIGCAFFLAWQKPVSRTVE
jgi:2-polyprenyl-3-methyl-5-hydroxy-6-metoxy-1,4-benzoquinol methylase